MKVQFDLPSGRIAIEGDGPELLKILQAARELAPHVTQIQITSNVTESPPTSSEEPQRPLSSPSAGNSSSNMTMRQFARSLALDNASERIAALAYYINKIEGKPSFSPKEMDGWFTMCGFQKPAQIAMALFDTKRKYGYAESVSRGSWRISNQGENLIIRKIEERHEG
jgi:hypothetical protein